MILQEKLKYISSYTSRLLRNNFGRGPESCFAATAGHYLVLNIRGFISPMEEVLLKEKQQKEVDHARNIIVKSVLDELKGVLKVTLETEVESFFNDWNFPNNSGVIIAEIQEPLIAGEKSQTVDFGTLEAEVARISKLVQKVPEKIYCYQISPKLFIVKRKGILVPIEKALIRRGFQQELLFTKDELEKSYFHRDGQFDSIFGGEITDIFIDWNLIEDSSLICFTLK